MSGGYFNYTDNHIDQIAEVIEAAIRKEKENDSDSFHFDFFPQ